MVSEKAGLQKISLCSLTTEEKESKTRCFRGGEYSFLTPQCAGLTAAGRVA